MIEIKDKPYVEFGTGDVRIMSGVNEGVGIVGFANDSKHEVGEKEPTLIEHSKEIKEYADIYCTFNNLESLQAVMRELRWIENKMINIEFNK